jgi:DNA-binding NarL/FixJ family response regulator
MVVVPCPPEEGEAVAEPPQTVSAVAVAGQRLFVEALAAVLAGPPLSATVSAYSRSDEALEFIRSNRVDVVFSEIRAQPMGGLRLVSILEQERPGTPVILLGEGDDEELLVDAVRSRAAGLFTKEATPEELLAGIDTVMLGHRAIGSRVMSRLMRRLTRDRYSGLEWPQSPLSRSEVDILAMIGDAKSISDIAAIRRISHKTVRNHLSRIYRKLEIHGRTEAMLWAAHQGLTRQGGPSAGAAD